MHRLLADLRLASRSLLRARGYTLAAVLTLALGMGAATAIFTVLERVVLDPLPYPESGRLVRLKNPVPGVGDGEEWNLSTAQFFHYTRQVRSLTAIGLYRAYGPTVEVGGEPARATAALITASMQELIGARAQLGRLIGAADDLPGAPPVVVLTHGYWQRAFAGDRAVIGRMIRVNEQPMEVVGVLAPGTELPQERGAPGVRTDFWVPMQLDPAGPFRNNHVYPAIARLAAGASAAQVNAELAQLHPSLIETFPGAYSAAFFERYGWHTVAYDLKAYVVGDMARNLWIIFAAVGLVLAIAGANVANLFLVRVEGRRRELAIRTALGAGRGDLFRHGLAEALVLATAGGVGGFLIALWSIDALQALAPASLPRLDHLALDRSVPLFTLGLVVLLAGALSAMPVLHLGRGWGLAGLGDGGRGATAGRERQRLRGGLVVAQVALALVLVISSGLLVRTFGRLRAVDPGVRPAGVLTVEVSLPFQRYDSLEKVSRFHDQLAARVAAIPGVVGVGASQLIPLSDSYGCTVQSFGDPAVQERIAAGGGTNCAAMGNVTPGYFATLGIPVVAGRGITAEDVAEPARGAVVVSRAFAERFWPGEDPLGKEVRPFNNRPPFYRVVGVVGDVRGAALDEPPPLAIYYPMLPLPDQPRWNANGMTLVVRTASGDPLHALAAIRRAVNEVDPAIPLANAETLESLMAGSMGRLTFTMLLLGLAGGMALLLAAIGLYGLISYLVTRRTTEIGVRIALGARPAQVEGYVVGGSLRLALVGLAAGLAGAALTSRLLRGLLYDVAPWDPLSYAASVLLLALVAAGAAWVPARRAARIDPSVALRSD